MIVASLIRPGAAFAGVVLRTSPDAHHSYGVVPACARSLAASSTAYTGGGLSGGLSAMSAFGRSGATTRGRLIVTGAQTGAPPSKPPSRLFRKIIKSWSWENFFLVWICRAVVFVGISPALLILGAGNWVASLIVIGAIFVLLSGINFDID